MREMWGVPVPESLGDLRQLKPAQVRTALARLSPLVRGQVMAELRRQLDWLQHVEQRRGTAAAQKEVARTLLGYGVTIPRGQEPEAYRLVVPLLKSLLGTE